MYSYKNRKEQTDAEKRLWFYLRNRRLNGYKFRRQYPIHNYIIDFYCAEKKLAVELDGGQHVQREKYDKKRTFDLQKLNIRIIRFWDTDVLQNIDRVLEQILHELESSTIKKPRPDPLLKGEGKYNDVQEAIRILNLGGIVIFPTDTAFAIGCRIDNEKAIEKLFQIRKRPLSQATPVLVDGFEMAQQYLKPIPQEVKEKLINLYWPGALTIVLPCLKEKISALVRGSSGNLGVRMPSHEIALSLIRGVGVPLLGPSANFHGSATPFQFQDLDKELVSLVDFVVEGECGIKQVSTVIDCSRTPWKILRYGAVKISD